MLVINFILHLLFIYYLFDIFACKILDVIKIFQQELEMKTFDKKIVRSLIQHLVYI